jgi:hypothetical protein
LHGLDEERTWNAVVVVARKMSVSNSGGSGISEDGISARMRGHEDWQQAATGAENTIVPYEI